MDDTRLALPASKASVRSKLKESYINIGKKGDCIWCTQACLLRDPLCSNQDCQKIPSRHDCHGVGEQQCFVEFSIFDCETSQCLGANLEGQ